MGSQIDSRAPVQPKPNLRVANHADDVVVVVVVDDGHGVVIVDVRRPVPRRKRRYARTCNVFSSSESAELYPRKPGDNGRASFSSLVLSPTVPHLPSSSSTTPPPPLSPNLSFFPSFFFLPLFFLLLFFSAFNGRARVVSPLRRFNDWKISAERGCFKVVGRRTAVEILNIPTFSSRFYCDSGEFESRVGVKTLLTMGRS